MMKVVVLEPENKSYVKEINGHLEELQGIVDGYIEIIGSGDKVVIIGDEEGMIKNKPTNALGSYGTVFFIGIENDEFRGLDRGEIEGVLEYLHNSIKLRAEGVV